MKLAQRSLIGLAGLALLAGCAQENRGVDKERRLESRVGDGTRLGSADLAAATDAMVGSIAQVPAIREAGERVVIVLDEVDNKTRMRSQEFDAFLGRLRALLNQSDVRRDLVFVGDRSKTERIKSREGYPVEQSARTLPKYALTGTAYEVRRASRSYYLLTFQMVDLATDIITWEDSYELKL
jgi:hypothetical protein